MEQANNLEKHYFERLKDIFQQNGTSFFKNITSQYLFEQEEETYAGKSVIADAMERIVQSIITNNTDWEIYSHPASSDSTFLTPKAVIHIDCKSMLDTDNDAIQHYVDLGTNQTSYASTVPIIYKDVPFKSNLPTIYNHQLYGRLYCLTYIVKIVYNLSNGIESLRNFKVYLASVPNGLLNPVLGQDFVQAGKVMERPFYTRLEVDKYNEMICVLNKEEQDVLNNCYFLSEDSTEFIANEWLFKSKNSLHSPFKEHKDNCENIFFRYNFNVQRKKLRIKFMELPINNESIYNWDRHNELNLL